MPEALGSALTRVKEPAENNFSISAGFLGNLIFLAFWGGFSDNHNSLLQPLLKPVRLRFVDHVEDFFEYIFRLRFGVVIAI